MGKAAGRCPTGSALWSEIRRWRSQGGLWVVVRVQTPGTAPLVLWGLTLVGCGTRFKPHPINCLECSARILPGSYLACTIQGKPTGSGLCWRSCHASWMSKYLGALLLEGW